MVSWGVFCGSLGGHTSIHHAVDIQGVGGSQQQTALADLLSDWFLQRLHGFVQGGEAGLREAELCLVVGHNAILPITAEGHTVRCGLAPWRTHKIRPVGRWFGSGAPPRAHRSTRASTHTKASSEPGPTPSTRASKHTKAPSEPGPAPSTRASKHTKAPSEPGPAQVHTQQTNKKLWEGNPPEGLDRRLLEVLGQHRVLGVHHLQLKHAEVITSLTLGLMICYY